MRRFFCLFMGLCLLSACGLPQGAALQSRILKTAEAPEADVQVIPVTRALAEGMVVSTRGFAAKPWPKRTAGANTATIRTGDRLDITIWDTQENSLLTGPEQKFVAMQGLEVGTNGAIYVPFVEEVHVRGLTSAGARNRVQARLADISAGAQVQLSLSQGQQSTVDLVSGVRNPGSFPLPARNYSILSLISAGGGVSPEIENPIIRLFRGETEYELPVAKLLADASRNVTLRAGDKVAIVPDDRRFTALGASGVEDMISFPKSTLSAMEAIALMGGLQENRADAKGVLVLRETGGERSLYVIDLTTADGLFAARNFTIRPNDTILATEASVTRTRAILGLFGQTFGVAGQARAVN